MRMTTTAAIMGLAFAVPAASSIIFVPTATAQSVSGQQAVQAQLIALAQSGDWAGFNAIVNRELAAGRASMLATIAGNISNMGLGIVDTDPMSAVAMQLAAMAIVDNAAVIAAKPSIGASIGITVGQVKAKVARRNPAGAAALASAAARNSAPGLMVAYNAGQSYQPGDSTNTQVVVVVRQRPPAPDTPTVPIIIEPNPDQSGSPT